MNISNYKPKEPPVSINDVINELFKDRIHKKIEIDKSDFTSLPMLQLNHLRREYSQISQRSNYMDSNEDDDKILLCASPKIEPVLKTKFIKKHLRLGRHMQTTKGLQKKYNDYLVNYMHKSNLLLIRDRVPPNLSVLETVDQGNYILNDDGTEYLRKDYPHYSNVIKLHEMPVENSGFIFMNKPQKIRPEELYFQVEDNCVLKLKKIYQFVSILFKRSIQFAKKTRLVKIISNTNKPQEDENHDFQAIAQEIEIHYRTVKLMYDILNEFYGFQREIIKGEDSKEKASKQICQSLKDLLKNYTSNEAIHIPHSEIYISLRELRQILHAKMLQEMEEQQ